MKVLRFKEAYPTSKVGLWCEDEHRLGLKPIVLVVDKAGWHTAKKLRVPEGIHLEVLPPRSPELQPAERLWPLSYESVANRHFETMENLKQTLVERCVTLSNQSEIIRSYTNYHWWREVA